MITAAILAGALTLCTPHTDAQFQACLKTKHPGRHLLIQPDKGRYVLRHPLLLHDAILDGSNGVKLVVSQCVVEVTSSGLTIEDVDFIGPAKKPLVLFCHTRPNESPGRGDSLTRDSYNGGGL